MALAVALTNCIGYIIEKDLNKVATSNSSFQIIGLQL
jgi:hypothetical protein